MTSALERDMDKIAESQVKKDDVIKESRIMLRSVFDRLETNRNDIGKALRLGSALDSPIGPCPLCGSPLVIRETKPDKRKFIACSGFPNCRNTFNLSPGSYKYSKDVCEKHKLHRITVTPPSTKDKDGKTVKGKAYEYRLPRLQERSAFRRRASCHRE